MSMQQRKSNRRVHRGFTLIELLLVMVIISILAAIVVPKFTGQGEKARIKAAMQDISNIKTSLETFEVENGRYPTTEEGVQALVTNPGNLPNWSKGLEKVPVDPWQRPYKYTNNGADYELYSTGPSGQDGSADNIK